MVRTSATTATSAEVSPGYEGVNQEQQKEEDIDIIRQLMLPPE